MKTSTPKLILALMGLCWLAGTCTAQAQPAPPSAAVSGALSEAEIKARYQNCSNGHYNGPQPGKTHYIKESWVWAVTPEFATKFCMPPEYVSTELKGAEAVAYKLLKPQDEENCGEQGNPKICETRTEHRFEIYYRNGMIPKELELSYYHLPYLPSAIFISSTRKDLEHSIKARQAKPKYGALDPFFRDQFGLQSIKGDKITWPLATLIPWIYGEELFQGIDYLALEGDPGFSRTVSWAGSGTRKMAITVRKPGTTHEPLGMLLSDFALTIELPQSMADRIVANDRGPGSHPKGFKSGAKNKP
ncbi:hypothetical protein [Polaromonas sp. YR568]|uniref:hypothetical protein n=1 Tax=Polaromonas sp. YR568 TaxID=1855301 RepID=UPI00398BCF2F